MRLVIFLLFSVLLTTPNEAFAVSRTLGPGESKLIEFINPVCGKKLDVNSPVIVLNEIGKAGVNSSGQPNWWIRNHVKNICDRAGKICEGRVGEVQAELAQLAEKWKNKCKSEMCQPYSSVTGGADCSAGEATVTCPDGSKHPFKRVNGIVQWPPSGADPCGLTYKSAECWVPGPPPPAKFDAALSCAQGSTPPVIEYNLDDDLVDQTPIYYNIYGRD